MLFPRFSRQRRVVASLLAAASLIGAVIFGMPSIPAAADEAPVSAAQSAVAPDWCQPTGTLDASTLPASFHLDACPVVGRVVRDLSVGAVVPPPGEAVYAAASGVGHDEFHIKVSTNGVVTLEEVGAEDTTSPTGGDGDPMGASLLSTYNECDDEAHNELNYWETDVHTWLYNRNTTPANLAPISTENELRQGTNHINTLYNDCSGRGIGNLAVSAQRQNSFAGQTSNVANIDLNGVCGSRDNLNVVTFGDLPTGTLAATCTWVFILFGEVMESDIKYNKIDHSWVIGVSGCSGSYDVEAVTVHERGHTFGMGHVSETGSPTMTMSPEMDPCSDRERTLGYGDMLGLINK